MKSQILERYKTQLIVIFIGFICFSAVSYLLQLHHQSYTFPDSYSYLLSIKQLYFEHTLNDHRPFLFSFLSGIPLFLDEAIENIFNWSLVLNLFSWLGTSLLLYKILSNLYKNNIAILFTIFNLLLVGSIAICFHLLTEPLFTFLLIIIFYYIQKFEITKESKFLSIAISLLLLSLLIKPILKFFILIVFVFYFKHFGKMLKTKFSFYLVMPIFLVFFQMYSLKRNYGDFTLSYIDTATYFNYLGTKADCFKNDIKFEQGQNQRHSYFSKFSPTDGKKIALNDFKNQLSDNKTNLLKAYFSNLYINSTKGSASVFGCRNVNKRKNFEKVLFFFKGITKIQNIILTVLGLILAFHTLIRWRKSMSFIMTVSVAFLYIFFISGISSDQGDRLHLIFYPLVIIMLVNWLSLKTKSKPFAELLQK